MFLSQGAACSLLCLSLGVLSVTGCSSTGMHLSGGLVWFL